MEDRFINRKLEKKIHSVQKINDILNSESDGDAKVISFVNPFSYAIVAKNSDVTDAVDYWFCDGSLMCALTNLRRDEHIKRASFDFSSIASDVIAHAESNRIKVGFVGAKEDEIHEAIRNIRAFYPDLDVVFAHNGYISDLEYQTVLDDLKDSHAEFLIVGMGTPHQEKFAIDCKKNVKSLNLIFTCGGFLTQTAIKGDYYHPLVKKLGLRWLQRAFLHSHVRKRLVRDYPVFILRYLFDR